MCLVRCELNETIQSIYFVTTLTHQKTGHRPSEKPNTDHRKNGHQSFNRFSNRSSNRSSNTRMERFIWNWHSILSLCIMCIEWSVTLPCAWLFWYRRRQVFYAARMPSVVVLCIIGFSVQSSVILLGDILSSAGWSYNCNIYLAASVLSFPFLYMPMQFRAKALILRFDTRFRTKSNVKFMSVSYLPRIMFFTSVGAMIVFVALFWAWPVYRCSSCPHDCAIFSDWYVYVALFLFTLWFQRERTRTLKLQSDLYFISDELRLTFLWFGLFCSIYLVIEIVGFFNGFNRWQFDAHYIPVAYIVVLIDFISLYFYGIRPHFLWERNKQQYMQLQPRTVRSSKKSATNACSSIRSPLSYTTITTGSDLMKTLDGSDDDFLLDLYQKNTSIDNASTAGASTLLNSKSKMTNAIVDGTSHHHWKLRDILRDKHLLQAFIDYSRSALCAENCVFLLDVIAFRRCQRCIKTGEPIPEPLIDADIHNAQDMPNYMDAMLFYQYLFDNFISVNSPCELNIISSMRQQYAKILELDESEFVETDIMPIRENGAIEPQLFTRHAMTVANGFSDFRVPPQSAHSLSKVSPHFSCSIPQQQLYDANNEQTNGTHISSVDNKPMVIHVPPSFNVPSTISTDEELPTASTITYTSILERQNSMPATYDLLMKQTRSTSSEKKRSKESEANSLPYPSCKQVFGHGSDMPSYSHDQSITGHKPSRSHTISILTKTQNAQQQSQQPQLPQRQHTTASILSGPAVNNLTPSERKQAALMKAVEMICKEVHKLVNDNLVRSFVETRRFHDIINSRETIMAINPKYNEIRRKDNRA